MFVSNEMNTETKKEITTLIILIIIIFIMFIGALITLLYKLIYAHLEEEFKIQRELAKGPREAGIRPISAFIPAHLNSQLDIMYENRRGTTRPLRNEQRLSFDKSFVQQKRVEFAAK